MKYLLIISCLLFTSIGWSKDINSDDLVKRDGEWLFYNRNDQLKKTKIYKDGKLIETIKN